MNIWQSVHQQEKVAFIHLWIWDIWETEIFNLDLCSWFLLFMHRTDRLPTFMVIIHMGFDLSVSAGPIGPILFIICYLTLPWEGCCLLLILGVSWPECGVLYPCGLLFSLLVGWYLLCALGCVLAGCAHLCVSFIYLFINLVNFVPCVGVMCVLYLFVHHHRRK